MKMKVVEMSGISEPTELRKTDRYRCFMANKAFEQVNRPNMNWVNIKMAFSDVHNPKKLKNVAMLPLTINS